MAICNFSTSKSQRAVAYLIPLLRMADSLDRSHGQRIRSVECRQRDSDFLITLNVPPETDIDLEIWAAERLAEIFRQVYNKPTVVVASDDYRAEFRGSGSSDWFTASGERDFDLPEGIRTVKQIHSAIVQDAACDHLAKATR